MKDSIFATTSSKLYFKREALPLNPRIMRSILISLYLASSAFAFDWQSDVNSGDFTSESHPADDNQIRKQDGRVTQVRNGTWLSYEKFDFGAGTSYLWLEAASASASGKIELRLGSASGTLIGAVELKNTGGLNAYKFLGATLPRPVKGVHDLYLKFVGGDDMNCNIGKFRFQRLAPDYKPAAAIPWIKRDPVRATPAGGFTDESHPSDDGKIRAGSGEISYIGNETWVEYKGFDFGQGANSVTLQAASETSGGTVELRLGNPTSGDLIGTVAIAGTGSWSNFSPVTTNLTKTVSGVQDLYFRFVGKDWVLFNLKDFRFQLLDAETKSTGRLLAANQFDQKSNGGADKIPKSDVISSLKGGGWISYDKFNFGQGANLVTVMAATPNKGGLIEMWIDSADGPLQIASVDVTHTGSWTHFREYTAAVTKEVRGSYKLYVRFVDIHQQGGNLFNLQNLIFEKQAPKPQAPSHEGTLHIYDAVPGLDPSPYYTYSVQKVSELNAPLKQDATNWLNPFAWFSECKTGSDSYSTAYYSSELAGWSQTYCNFEMGKNTPIVVKITRKQNSFGAPSGPIFMANVHPAHKVESCEIINGDVYVTMKEPALVTVDIDGQMDCRDAPRIDPAEMASSKPFASREKGCHAVSIFANPVIQDKPVIGAPGVKFIKPGDPLPASNDPSWTTLYFGKGVHHFSRNPDDSPGIWKNGDAYVLMSDKICYIPGDAMIYGNFDGRAEKSDKHRVRIYGYGTVSGARMPHWQDEHWKLPAQAGTDYLDRGIAMSSGNNCSFEGVTLADPANHGIAFERGGGNTRRWMKQVSWRANSDMGGIPGVVEDCFFRLQDDGPYVSSLDFRRNTLWFDCNGSPFRGTFIRKGTHSAGHQTVVEDCDVIYVRSNWGGGVIGAYDYWEIGNYPDGTKNTAQHVIFRNIRVTDPRPTRPLFELIVPADKDSGLAGMRFENVEFRHPHSWRHKSNIEGAAKGPIHHCYFDRVWINGRILDVALLANESVFETKNVSNMVFRDSTLKPQTKR
jgi:hypothetical protein